MILGNTTSTLTAQAGSNPGANVPVVVDFVEQVDQQRLEGKGGEGNPQTQTSQMATGGTTKVTILSAPDTGRRRIAKRIAFKNTSASDIAYTFRFEDSAATVTAVIRMTVSLLTGECAEWTDTLSWRFWTAAGHLK